jgi:hypothetical protein
MALIVLAALARLSRRLAAARADAERPEERALGEAPR